MDRREAIDILVGVIATNSEEENEALDLAIEALGDAESATTTDCISRQQAVEEIALHDCTNGEVPYFTGKGVQEILNTLPPVTPTERTGWIPVSERLPECTGDVLVTVGIHRHGFGMYDEIRVATWNTVYRVFYVHEREEVICGEIIAWQPLPEIYRPEGENK